MFFLESKVLVVGDIKRSRMNWKLVGRVKDLNLFFRR